MRTLPMRVALGLLVCGASFLPTTADAITLTDMLVFSADENGYVVPGHGLDTRNGSQLGNNLFDIFLSQDFSTPWSQSCDPFSCPDAPAGVIINTLTAIDLALEPGDNVFKFYGNLPYPGYADPSAIKSYQIVFYFDGADYISGAPAGIAAYVLEDGSFSAFDGPISNINHGPFAPSAGLLTFQNVELVDLDFEWNWLDTDTGVGQFNLRVSEIAEPATTGLIGFGLAMAAWAGRRRHRDCVP